MTTHTLHLGDCLEVLRTMPDCSVDAVVTDPPYGLAFMGKAWDYDVPGVDVWREVLRVLKPGGHLLAFAGTRTQHRMAVAIEDAGFEIRDMIAWVYGSGFPKSADVSKQLDAHTKKEWLDVCKALDNMSKSSILEAWKNYSSTASNAGLSFQRSETATGTSTLKNGFALAHVLLQANPENSDAAALVAELRSTEARLTCEASCNSALLPAESRFTESKSRASTAESQHASPEATLSMADSSALHTAWGWHGESMADNLRAVEALKTWLGSKPSSRQADTAALCVALTEDLKRIILSQSKTFRNFDTTRQTDCVSAINVTITEYTAANLISFTADTLKSKAIDKAAGAEREVVGSRRLTGTARIKGQAAFGGTAGRADEAYAEAAEINDTLQITAPATDAARQWEGWGTALKPSWECITMARRPLVGTVAANVLQHGTGALNVDGCRVGTAKNVPASISKKAPANCYGKFAEAGETPGVGGHDPNIGRWPANLIHDGSDDVVGLFPQAQGMARSTLRRGATTGTSIGGQDRYGTAAPQEVEAGFGDSGSAARFFYTPKATAAERQGCSHPTVKPLDLMAYLCRLVTPPGGIVLDPFMGSGTTIKAALSEGFSAIGIEREPAYFAMAEHRLNGAQLGLSLEVSP